MRPDSICRTRTPVKTKMRIAADVVRRKGWFAKWRDPFRKLPKSCQIARSGERLGLIYDFGDRIHNLRNRQPTRGDSELVRQRLTMNESAGFAQLGGGRQGNRISDLSHEVCEESVAPTGSFDFAAV